MNLENAIFNITTEAEFNALALQVFKFQFEHNAVYRSFCDLLYTHPSDVHKIEEIPFLPIQFFKTHKVLSSTKPSQKVFTSSGTTGHITSKHYVTDISLYQQSYTKGFAQFYGAIENYAVLALLPSYLERKGSSLIDMTNDFIRRSKHPKSGFYLNEYDELISTLNILESEKQPTLLIGVSFALLDLIETTQLQLKHTIIMETGGMKGRRQEMIRAELHQKLKQGFGVSIIHSEYGMTELLSQAYSKGNGVFKCPPWMKVLIRDTEDALSINTNLKASGGVNVIDFANLYSCSFIATQDLGKTDINNTFEIMGRFDHSDIRGCNLMVI